MPYLIKDGRATALAFGFKGALAQLALAGDDAIIVTLLGTCIAGRKVLA